METDWTVTRWEPQAEEGSRLIDWWGYNTAGSRVERLRLRVPATATAEQVAEIHTRYNEISKARAALITAARTAYQRKEAAEFTRHKKRLKAIKAEVQAAEEAARTESERADDKAFETIFAGWNK
jgi:hypothetical protein